MRNEQSEHRMPASLDVEVYALDVFFTTVGQGSLGTQADKIYYPMNRFLKERLGDYGDGLKQWFLLFAILGPNVLGHDAPERVLWKKKSRELDMRLTVDFDAFKSGSEADRRGLLVACMRRSLNLMEAKEIPDFNVAALKHDFEQIVADEKWDAL